MKKRRRLKIIAALIGLPLLVSALIMTNVLPSPLDLLRPGPRQQDMNIDHSVRNDVVEGLISALQQSYIFPDIASEMDMQLREQLQSGAYNSISSAKAFAKRLSADLQQISHDLHLQVFYSEAAIESAPENKEQALTATELSELKRLNFGIGRIERLGFNIGYVELFAFEPANLVASRFAAIMTLMSDTRALIIDLRDNHGGDPESVALLSSYFFDERQHLGNIYYREGDRTEEFWTHDEIAGNKYGEQRKVYLLISDRTFSAGEDFAYQLKNLNRATLIGESTAGGAHPGDFKKLTPHFEVMVPNGRSISPITQSNWEGVGVLPDVELNADKALDHAQLMILKERLITEKDDFIRGRIKANIADWE